MHKILILSLLFVLFVIPANGATDYEKFAFYNNCKPFSLQIITLANDAKLKEETLKNLIESKLLSARIDYHNVPSAVKTNETLMVTAICIASAFPPCSVHTDFIKHTVTSYGIRGTTSTWTARKTTSLNRNSILSIASETVDAFIVGYLKVNQKDCK